MAWLGTSRHLQNFNLQSVKNNIINSEDSIKIPVPERARILLLQTSHEKENPG